MCDFPVPNHPYNESAQCSCCYLVRMVLSGDAWCVVVYWFQETNYATVCRYTRYFQSISHSIHQTQKTLTRHMIGFFFFIYSYHEGVVSSVLSDYPIAYDSHYETAKNSSDRTYYNFVSQYWLFPEYLQKRFTSPRSWIKKIRLNQAMHSLYNSNTQFSAKKHIICP